MEVIFDKVYLVNKHINYSEFTHRNKNILYMANISCKSLNYLTTTLYNIGLTLKHVKKIVPMLHLKFKQII